MQESAQAVYVDRVARMGVTPMHRQLQHVPTSELLQSPATSSTACMHTMQCINSTACMHAMQCINSSPSKPLLATHTYCSCRHRRNPTAAHSHQPNSQTKHQPNNANQYHLVKLRAHTRVWHGPDTVHPNPPAAVNKHRRASVLWALL